MDKKLELGEKRKQKNKTHKERQKKGDPKNTHKFYKRLPSENSLLYVKRCHSSACWTRNSNASTGSLLEELYIKMSWVVADGRFERRLVVMSHVSYL